MRISTLKVVLTAPNGPLFAMQALFLWSLLLSNILSRALRKHIICIPIAPRTNPGRSLGFMNVIQKLRTGADGFGRGVVKGRCSQGTMSKLRAYPASSTIMGKVTVYCGVRVLLISILLIPQCEPGASPSSKLLLANCTLASVISPAASVSHRSPMQNTARKRGGEADVDHADKPGVGQAREDGRGGGSVWVMRCDAGGAKGDAGKANGVEAGKMNGVEEGNGRREDKTRRTHTASTAPTRRTPGGEGRIPVYTLGDEDADAGVVEQDGAVGNEGEGRPGVASQRKRGGALTWDSGVVELRGRSDSDDEGLQAEQRLDCTGVGEYSADTEEEEKFSLSLAYSMGSTGEDTEIGEEDTDEVSEGEEAGANEAMSIERTDGGDVNVAVTRGRVTPPSEKVVLTADNRPTEVSPEDWESNKGQLVISCTRMCVHCMGISGTSAIRTLNVHKGHVRGKPNTKSQEVVLPFSPFCVARSGLL
ncbi:hypothetical protein FIBSPDRAFT_924833 [Athelia psychrophila]|uniref:Uncharacterized protein n=1 Tax=Athelia psychrophila TaxID=1759441 RepID=A0A166VI99_9AGAM|nr:hypothetical protein FIBSPDRAFT_924833 [Fibularhizoctonia sp. CBS 109695]